MRVVVTGGAGFIGRAVVGLLRARGDDVLALVRDPGRAGYLQALGCDTVACDLSDRAELVALMAGADAVIHGAGSYRVGIPSSERPAMWDANVGATERVLDAAIEAGVPRIVYVSTANTAGDTHGAIVDEAYRRDVREGFQSWYDETKFRAHEAAQKRIAAGAPIVVVLPGTVYGRGDHTLIGDQIRLAYLGKLPYISFAEFGMTPVHVDDVAAGIVVALDRGTLGEAYALPGAPMRVGAVTAAAARAGGKRPPRLTMPTFLLWPIAQLAPLLSRIGLSPPDLREALGYARATMWMGNERAQRELGWQPRDLATGVRDAFGGSWTAAG
ncbi:MAG TPA: NAD-dependent epimerase/dehydratase family protein [Candidatus Eisenbacteria bacterium]|nr:NAD-dependent epimerase/dehydratase family protein [Candidatus Eisenbacteria bacterium]